MQSSTVSSPRTATGAGALMIGGAAVLWGTVGVTTQALYDTSATNALSIGFFRLALSAPVLLLACWLFVGRAMFQIERRDWWLILALGALTATYQVCLFSAIRFVGVSIAVVITLCVAPVFVALASVRLFGEQLTRWTLLALGLALIGTLLLSGGGAGLNATTGATITGVALALGSALGYGCIALIGRVLAPRYHPLQPIAFGFTAGAIILLPIALAQGLVTMYAPLGWALLLYMGLLPTAVAYVLFLFGMRAVSATTASVITLVEPLTAALLAWWLFDERLGPAGLLGGALLLGAIALLYRNEERR
ncbi:MAG: EamA family transporter [Roseiflexaceae bacterium]|nr:EamA family transporter [Roseiflexaceae bacterium]